MASTLALLEAVVKRLAGAFPHLAVELYPERPSEYRLNHPRGALLVGYVRSHYGAPVDTEIMAQERSVEVSVAVLMRGLHDGAGAVPTLDAVRQAVIGWKMPDCDKSRIVGDRFLDQSAGLWTYELTFSGRTLVLEDEEPDAGPILKHITTEDGFERTETIKHPDGSITYEEFPP
ncbi:MAG TPA: Gp37 family protein [bacterium]|nr:Gp37 family protein [bacterium]